jgi:hypothetical protein
MYKKASLVIHNNKKDPAFAGSIIGLIIFTFYAKVHLDYISGPGSRDPFSALPLRDSGLVLTGTSPE